MNQEVLIRKCQSINVVVGRTNRVYNTSDPRVLTLQAEVMRLGYVLSEDACKAISRLSNPKLRELYDEIVPVLQKLVGADVKWEPFYPNFPTQAMEASSLQLFFNAIVHYWSFGQWRPQYTILTRVPAFENVNFKTLHLAKPSDYMRVFTQLLESNASITDIDRAILAEIMSDASDADMIAALPERLPFKENLCWFVGECLANNREGLGVAALKTATDVLRVAAHLSGGDISLAENTKFKSFNRPLRRLLVNRLEAVVNQDDVFRHRGKWVRLAHALHVGDYAKSAPKTFAILTEARNSNSLYQTFNGKVENALIANDRNAVINFLTERPGVFARRLDHVIRTFGSRGVVSPFLKEADKIDTRLLLQLYGHFNTRTSPVTERVVYPKGGKARILRNRLEALTQESVLKLRTGISTVLTDRFAKLPSLGKAVYIDPALAGCPIPMALRNTSEALNVVARGTRMPLTEGNDTLRMFIYWKGQDIDLSAFFVNADFTKEERIAYYNLREDFGCHSGDIVSAPNGACEFIDIDMKKAVQRGFRYLAMSVLVFRGPKFSEHEICYAGWMTRSKPKSNELFDPKTVEQRITVTADSMDAIPVIFDMVERKAIWLDISTQRGYNLNVPNNVENNKAGLREAITSAINVDNKPTLYDLFVMHAQARAKKIVTSQDKADFSFGWNGDVKPTDTTKILAEYL